MLQLALFSLPLTNSIEVGETREAQNLSKTYAISLLLPHTLSRRWGALYGHNNSVCANHNLQLEVEWTAQIRACTFLI